MKSVRNNNNNNNNNNNSNKEFVKKLKKQKRIWRVRETILKNRMWPWSQLDIIVRHNLRAFLG